MRAAGGNPAVSHLFQAYCMSELHASPHPALRATFPPGEAFGCSRTSASNQETLPYRRVLFYPNFT